MTCDRPDTELQQSGDDLVHLERPLWPEDGQVPHGGSGQHDAGGAAALPELVRLGAAADVARAAAATRHNSPNSDSRFETNLK